jgi:uncharacterized membrane protein
MSKKTGIVYLIALSFFMSAALAVIVPAINTGAVTMLAFGIIFVISFVMTVFLGVVLPIPRMSAWFCRSLSQDPHTGLGKILSTMFATTLFMLIITFVMVAVLTGVGEVDGTNYLGRYMTGFLHIQPILVITTLLFDPFATAIAKRLTVKKAVPEDSLVGD